MKMGDLILVYGTLRPGHAANVYLRDKAEHKGSTRISATMYNCGWFPGIKLAAKGDFVTEGPKVTGDVYEITDEGLPEILDGYEGYPNLYGRKTVETEDGRKVWVYTYNHAVRDESIIGSGDWNDFQER